MAPATPAQPSAAAPAEKSNKNADIATGVHATLGSPPLANNNVAASAAPPRAGKANSTLDRLLSSTSALSHVAATGAPKLPASKAA
jgi:hypothetical protein